MSMDICPGTWSGKGCDDPHCSDCREMRAARVSESAPQIVSVTINFNGSGKVAIKDYGKISSGYGCSITREYSIPEHWTEERVAAFELEKVVELHDQLEPILQQEFDERYEQRDWN